MSVRAAKTTISEEAPARPRRIRRTRPLQRRAAARSAEDRAAQVAGARLGRVRPRGDPEEQADHRLRRREDHRQAEHAARSALPEAGAHLVLHAEPQLGDRRRRRRQRGALHQPQLPRQLLRPDHQGRDLDPRVAARSARARSSPTTTTRTAPRRSRAAAVPAARACSDVDVRALRAAVGDGLCTSSICTASRRRRRPARRSFWPSGSRALGVTLHAPDLNEPDFETLTVDADDRAGRSGDGRAAAGARRR